MTVLRDGLIQSVNTCDGCARTLYSCLDNFAINHKLFQTKRCCTEAPACDPRQEWETRETRRPKEEAGRPVLLSYRPPPHRLGPAQPPGLGALTPQSPPCPGPQAGTPMLQALGWPGPPLRPSAAPWAGRLQLPELTLPGPLRQAAPATHPVLPTHLAVSLNSWLRVHLASRPRED